MYKSLAAFLLVAATFIPFAAFAEDSTTAAPPKIVCPLIKAAVSRGVSGGSVLELQNFLASYYGVSTSTIATGFFGPKTHELVTRFQKEHGLDALGFVGPLTRAAIARACGFAGPAGVSGVSDGSSTARPPSCNLRASPITITPNQTVTFSWTSTGADYSVWGSGDKDNANESNRVFTNIASTTHFTLTFFGAGGTVTCGLTIVVPGTATTTPDFKRPPTGVMCPMIAWVQPTSTCDGVWAPTYGNGCQNGWQCLGRSADGDTGTTTPPNKKPICDLLPQILPACDGATPILDPNGCTAGFKCPVSSIKPADSCPQLNILPAPCDGTTIAIKDANGCQTGFRCQLGATTNPTLPIKVCPMFLIAPPTCIGGTLKPIVDSNGCQNRWECVLGRTNIPRSDPPVTTTPVNTVGACVTPWGAKLVADGQTIPYEPYFSLGKISLSVVIPLMKCSTGAWLMCDYLGNNCRPYVPIVQQLNSVSPVSEGRSASELATALVALQGIVNSALKALGQ